MYIGIGTVVLILVVLLLLILLFLEGTLRSKER